jgi:hypothetical protein
MPEYDANDARGSALQDTDLAEGSPCDGRAALSSKLAFQPLVALAVVAAAFLNPIQPAVPAASFVRFVLIETGVHPRFASRFLCILR